VQVRQRVLATVVVCIVVCIDCLSFQPGNRVELLDRGCTQTGQSAEDGAFDLSHLRILNCVNQCVLSLCGVVLQFLRGVFFPERSNLVEVHLQIVRHLLRQIVRWIGPMFVHLQKSVK